MKHCVSSALLLNTPPIKNLLSQVQEPPDPITRVQVGLGVEGHVPSPSLVSLNKVFPAISQLQRSSFFNKTNKKVKIKPTVICQREISSFLSVQRGFSLRCGKNCHQQESKNYATFCPHAFRAKDDSMCHMYPFEDCVKGSRVIYSNYYRAHNITPSYTSLFRNHLQAATVLQISGMLKFLSFASF